MGVDVYVADFYVSLPALSLAGGLLLALGAGIALWQALRRRERASIQPPRSEGV